MIVVCGEALMDVFDAGATATGNTLDARIGGSPYNVALGLARLAQPVAFCGAVSTGFLGERLMRSLADEGIDTACVQRTAAPTSICIIGLDAHGVPAYDFYGERGADRQLDAERRPGQRAGRCTRLSLRLVRDGRRAGGRRAARADRARTRAGLDLLRPEHPPHRRAVAADLARHAGLDAAAHAPAQGQRRRPGPALPRPHDRRARRVVAGTANGPRLVVITRGGEGALGFTASAQRAGRARCGCR